MPVQLGAKPLADFDQPIDLMMDCHRRVERFLAVLIAVAQGATDGRLNGEQHAALTTALEYFRRSAPQHTADEEQSLFPRLRACDDPRAAAALGRVERLEADHRRVKGVHDRLDELGWAWLVNGGIDADEQAEFLRLAHSLADAYRQHIHCEDHEVFPIARQLLGAAELHEIGTEMKDRRRHTPGREGSRCAARRQATLGRQV